MDNKAVYFFISFITVAVAVISLVFVSYQESSNRQASLLDIIGSPTPTFSPTPTPDSSPSPTPSPTPYLSPSPSVSPSPSLSPFPTFSPAPSPILSPTPVLTPSLTPSPSRAPSPSPSPSASPTPSPSPSASPSPTPSAKPIISIYRDPDFIKKAKEERGVVLVQTEITPYDDIIIDVGLPKSNKFSNTNYFFVKLSENIKNTDNGEPFLLGLNLKYLDEKAYEKGDYNHYQLKISGWNKGEMNGIADEKEVSIQMPNVGDDYMPLDNIVAVLYKASNNVVAKTETGENIFETEEIARSPEYRINFCFQLWGDVSSPEAKKRLVPNKGYNAAFILSNIGRLKTTAKSKFLFFKDMREKGFLAVSPYKDYINNFSFSYDLRDSWFTLDFQNYPGVEKTIFEAFNKQAISLEKDGSSCLDMDLYLTFVEEPPADIVSMSGLTGVYPIWYSSVFTLIPRRFDLSNLEATMTRDRIVKTMMHETNHFFGAKDEYYTPSISWLDSWPNCILGDAVDPCKRYKENFLPATGGTYYNQGCFKGCADSQENNYRSTLTSLMQNTSKAVLKNNLVSCFIILRRIRNNLNPSQAEYDEDFNPLPLYPAREEFYQECQKMDIVIPDRCYQDDKLCGEGKKCDIITDKCVNI